MTTPAVTVTARTASRWRCGEQFGAQPKSFPAGHWSEEQLRQLRGDPMLVVAKTGAQESPPPGAGLPTTPTVEAALDAAISALRQATPDQVMGFAILAGGDPEIVSKLDSGRSPDDVAQAILGHALEVLRHAEPDPVRAFVARLGEDPEIASKLEVKLVPGENSETDPREGLEPGETLPDRPADWPVERRLEAIVEAIRGLDLDAKINLTKSGTPSVEAIEHALGWDISAAERNTAWKRFQESTAAPAGD